MSSEITSEILSGFKSRLEDHPIYEAVAGIEDLRCFMEHHVYSVWDFMSLIKYLQSVIAPTSYPWSPRGDGSVRRFINELVLEEESDETQTPGQFSSHFELYHKAMTEIGAETAMSAQFVQTAATQGIEQALALPGVPEPSRRFTTRTFSFINANKPHEVAAALALGREHIIPCMFRAILKRIGVSDQQAPIFHFYLNRHIHLDEDFHAPLSLKLLNGLCAGDATKTQEAIAAANSAVNARIEFWDGVLAAIRAAG
ncbi:MAG: DUF3050 domain-containing protein [Gammaproteobacteria bacterium]|nr:DUF3050 domain-containing protein [Gammaproteobacteria bacterium]